MTTPEPNVSVEERERMRRAKAMHDAVTGAPEVWDELPESHEDWAQTADEYERLAALRTPALPVQPERERRESRGVELIRREYERFEDGQLNARPHPSWRDVGVLLAALCTDPPEEKREPQASCFFCSAPFSTFDDFMVHRCPTAEPQDPEPSPTGFLIGGPEGQSRAAQQEAELVEAEEG